MLDTNLINQGVTAEDLEKAASVRLFEKAAAAQGIDLNQFSTEDVEELYNNFVNGEEQMDAVEIFEKVAEAEGIELDTLEDEQLAGLFNHFVEEVLPEMIAAEEGGEEVGEDEEIEEAQMKLAEAEILGRHMARAFIDEQEKLAAAASDNAMVPYKAPEVRNAAAAKPGRMAGAVEFLKKHKKPAIAAGVVGAAGLGGLAYARSRKKKKAAEAMKSASILEKLAASSEDEKEMKLRRNARRALGHHLIGSTLGSMGGSLAGGVAGGALGAALGSKNRAAASMLGTATGGQLGAIGGGVYGGYRGLKRHERTREKSASVEEMNELEALAQERAFEALIDARAEEILAELE